VSVRLALVAAAAFVVGVSATAQPAPAGSARSAAQQPRVGGPSLEERTTPASRGPALTVTRNGGEATATLTAADARMWRVSIVGEGALLGRSVDVVVETGDVEFVVTLTESGGGRTFVRDLSDAQSGRLSRTCATRLPICLEPDAFRLPADGDGTVALTISRTSSVDLRIEAATATWDREPFILGPWTIASPLEWAAGASSR
jgi:hypothetical protein